MVTSGIQPPDLRSGKNVAQDAFPGETYHERNEPLTVVRRMCPVRQSPFPERTHRKGKREPNGSCESRNPSLQGSQTMEGKRAIWSQSSLLPRVSFQRERSFTGSNEVEGRSRPRSIRDRSVPNLEHVSPCRHLRAKRRRDGRLRRREQAPPRS